MSWQVVWCDCWLSDFVTMGELPMPALFERASSGLTGSHPRLLRTETRFELVIAIC